MGAKKGESSASKAAREEYNNIMAEQKQQMAQYQKLVAENTGMQGYQKSLDAAAQNAGKMSVGQAQGAANQAIQAGRAAGQSKAAAAMNAMNSAANVYSGAYGQNLNNQQTQAAGQLNNQVQGQGEVVNQYNNQLAAQQNAIKMQHMADDKNNPNRLGGILSGASSGAMAGGSIGGGWGALAGGVIGGIGGAL